jgi:hypothetical protein
MGPGGELLATPSRGCGRWVVERPFGLLAEGVASNAPPIADGLTLRRLKCVATVRGSWMQAFMERSLASQIGKRKCLDQLCPPLKSYFLRLHRFDTR